MVRLFVGFLYAKNRLRFCAQPLNNLPYKVLRKILLYVVHTYVNFYYELFTHMCTFRILWNTLESSCKIRVILNTSKEFKKFNSAKVLKKNLESRKDSFC